MATAPKAPEISIVVGTIPGRRDYFAACLKALAACAGVERSEVLVVTEEVAALEDVIAAIEPRPLVRVVPGPPALSGKRNRGVLESRAALVAFLDDDAEPAPDWIEGLLASFSEGADLVGGRIEPAFESPVPAWLRGREHLVRGFNSRGTWRRDGYFIGANFAVRREVFLALGLFHPDFGRGGHRYPHGEESELLARSRGRFRAAYGEGAPVRHAIQPLRMERGYLLRRSREAGATGAGIDELHRPGFGRNVVSTALMIPVALARGLRSRDALGTALRLCYLAGYVVEGLSLLARGRMRGEPIPRLTEARP